LHSRPITSIPPQRLDVVQCITVVDREEGVVERVAAEGSALEALVRRRDLTST
jgi:orotate phosphoribosyltransferase